METNGTQPQWSCLKCQNPSFEQGSFCATGAGLSKFFDVQNKKFYTLTCQKCGYTEIYKGKTGAFSNIVDFFTS